MSNLKHATQYLYAVVYLKEVANVWGLYLYSLKSTANKCWPDIRTLRTAGYATWIVKWEAVAGDNVEAALSERGLE
jgi:hypothetical protein